MNELDKKLEAGTLPAATKAPTAGAWKTGPDGVMSRDLPAAGVTETIENVGGNVFSQRKPYTPPPIPRNKSYAEILLADVPSRLNLMQQKLMKGDVEGAAAERAAVFTFIDENEKLLNDFTKYRGRDPVTTKAAQTALNLITRGFMDEKTSAMFDPTLNPMARKFQGAKSGASASFVSVMEAADKGDAESASIIQAVDGMTGATERTSAVAIQRARSQQPAPVAAEGGAEPLVPPVTATMFPAESRASIGSRFTEYYKKTGPVLFPAADGAAGPAGIADIVAPLFAANDGDVYNGGLSRFAVGSAGVAADDAPAEKRKKIADSARSTALLSSAWNSAPGLPVASRQLLLPTLDGIGDMLGAEFTVRTDVATRAIGKVAKTVADVASRGLPMDDASVRSLARIEIARETGSEAKLSPVDRKKLEQIRSADQAVSVDNLRADFGPVVKDMAGADGKPQQAPADEYHGLVRDRDDFVKAAALAKADIAVDGTGNGTFKDAFIKRSREVRTEGIMMKTGADAETAANVAEIEARYIADNRGANLATIYDDIYNRYGKTVNQMAMEQAKAMATSPAPSDRKDIYIAARANAAKLPPDDYDRGVWEKLRDLDVNAVDIAPGSKLWKDLNAISDGTASRVLVSALNAPKGVGEALAGLTVAEVVDPKKEDAIVDRIAPLLPKEALRLAPRFSGYSGEDGAIIAAKTLVRAYIRNARDAEELQYGAKGANKEAMALPLGEVFGGMEGVIAKLRNAPSSKLPSPQKISDLVGGAAVDYAEAVLGTPGEKKLDPGIAEKSFVRSMSLPFLKALAGDLRPGTTWESLTSDSGFQVPASGIPALKLAVKSFAPIFMGPEKLLPPVSFAAPYKGGAQAPGIYQRVGVIAANKESGSFLPPLLPGQNQALSPLSEEGQRIVRATEVRTGAAMVNAPIDYLLPGNQTAKAMNALRELQLANTRTVTDEVTRNALRTMRERLKGSPFEDDAYAIMADSLTANQGKMTAYDVQKLLHKTVNFVHVKDMEYKRAGEAYKSQLQTEARKTLIKYTQEQKAAAGAAFMPGATGDEESP